MKNYNPPTILIIVAICLTACSHDLSLATIINGDGSCTRELSFRADSSSLFSADYDFSAMEGVNLNNDDWTFSWGVKGDMSRHQLPISIEEFRRIEDEVKAQNHNKSAYDTLRIYAVRTFETIEEMESSPAILFRGKPLQSKITLRKSFKWFYTDYTYTETFPAVTQEFSTPLEQYMEPEVASSWFTGEPDLTRYLYGEDKRSAIDEMARKANNWMTANICDVTHKYICDYYDSIPNPPVDKDRFTAMHDSIVAYAIKNSFELDNITDNLGVLYSNYFHSHAYDILFDESTDSYNDLENRFEPYTGIFTLSFDYTLVLPGKMNNVTSNSPFTKKIRGENFIPHDYTISASSRQTNTWTFIITTLIILLAIGSLGYRKKEGK